VALGQAKMLTNETKMESSALFCKTDHGRVVKETKSIGNKLSDL